MVLVDVYQLQAVDLLLHLFDLVPRLGLLDVERLLQLDQSKFGILALLVDGVQGVGLVQDA